MHLQLPCFARWRYSLCFLLTKEYFKSYHVSLQTMNSSIPRSTPPQIPQAIYQAPNGSVFEEENPYM
jgi:hypothetical protein